MTRSETPISRTPSPAPAAPVWVGRVVAGLLFLAGAIYVLAVNRWHLTAPVVMLLLSWAAVVTLGFHLTRMAATVADDDDRGAPVTGARDDLEREKRKLVKAIKEVEFDRETGKMSEADAVGLIATYRTRAIAVLKELDQLDAEGVDSPRARVEADLRARLELDEKLTRGKGGKGKRGKAHADDAHDGGDA